MKSTAPLLLAASALLFGCAAAPAPEFSWYHPAGGEYLFEFDATECKAEVQAKGLTLGTDTGGPFFQCMHTRGYQLVTGPVRTVAASPTGDSEVSLNDR